MLNIYDVSLRLIINQNITCSPPPTLPTWRLVIRKESSSLFKDASSSVALLCFPPGTGISQIKTMHCEVSRPVDAIGKKCKNHQNLNFIGFWRRTCYTIFWRSRKSFAYFAPHIPRWSYMEGGQWNKTDILSEVNNCLGLGALLVGHKFRTLLSESGGYRTFLSVIAVHSRWG